MKEIKLTKNQVTKVDDEDYERLCQYKWYALFVPADGQYYAVRNGGPGKLIYMAREIMQTPAALQCDHVDGVKLNNQKHNLRNVTIKVNRNNNHPWINWRQKAQMKKMKKDGWSNSAIDKYFRNLSEVDLVSFN